MDEKRAETHGSTGGRRTLADWLTTHGPGALDTRSDDERTASDRRVAEWRCSVCGRPLGEHLIDQSGEHTMFECPVSIEDSDPVEQGPLNETGQTKL